MLPRGPRHLALLRTLTAPRPPSVPPALQRRFRQHMRGRFYSSQPQPGGSPNADFFKTFGRPIGKVFLLAIFTYQLAYFFWTSLEYEEIKGEMQATIAELEARVEQLEKNRGR
ncbi:hypothetical protein GGS23DRAFT_68173 [Durotheca rogersii]|uniref:uncharacterized protein n=1 Tax=Durotheca rogersii TaxID=419775 RepID=UPI00221E3CD2|nr:uncharacterized protein GGS23DRAFT_68173 [Durotheca rogersii]KAI5862802.1 hypothetical protein GGS23DRAFT_68173 [Durotheca rogersii]